MVQSNSCDSDPAISVVVPVRNEAGNIAPLVAEVEAALEGRHASTKNTPINGTSDEKRILTRHGHTFRRTNRSDDRDLSRAH